MNLTCNLFVDGSFEGSITSKEEITIGKNGRIKGDITTSHVIVQGLVEGAIEADKIEIKSGGKVDGSIISSNLIIESEGHFQGESKIKGVKQKEVESKKSSATVTA